MTDQLTKLKSEKFPVELRHDKNDKGGSQATGQKPVDNSCQENLPEVGTQTETHTTHLPAI